MRSIVHLIVIVVATAVAWRYFGYSEYVNMAVVFVVFVVYAMCRSDEPRRMTQREYARLYAQWLRGER